MANWVCRGRPPQRAGSAPASAIDQLRTSAAIWVGKFVVSNSVVRPMPDSPRNSRCQSWLGLDPKDVTHPRPVTTTRGFIGVEPSYSPDHRTFAPSAGSEYQNWAVATR